MKKPLSVSLIGLGRIATDDHLPAILEANGVKLDSVCDVSEERVHEISTQYKVDGFTDVETLVKEKTPEMAVVAVPHHVYLPILELLAEKQIPILKEKPLARNLEEAKKIKDLVERTNTKLLVTLQRRFNPIFSVFLQLRERIGEIYNFSAEYTLNIGNLEDGWRASVEKAGGGCLIDMGYHMTDLLMWYFGLPEHVMAHMGKNNREHQEYDVEDTCNVLMKYNPGEQRPRQITGNIFLSRVYPEKKEELRVSGTRGTIVVRRGGIIRYDNKGKE